MADSPPDRVLHIDMSSGSTRFEPFEHGTSAFVNVANLLVSLPTNNRRAGQADYAAFFGCEVSREEISDMAWQILENEWEFNRRAGFSAEDDHLPEWMTTEPLGPQEAVFDVDAEIIQAVYSRIDLGDELYSCRGSG
jgi:hypothetical protein